MESTQTPVLTGVDRVPIDRWGRVRIPARFRKALPDVSLMATLGPPPELRVMLFPASGWPEGARSTAREVRGAPGVRARRRMLLDQARALRPDSRGRLTVPKALRTPAGLAGRVLVVGQGARLELWSETAWATFMAGVEDAADRWAERGTRIFREAG